ncbi:MAG TPA: antibiotic biosynthesis monooxygenase [Anaerolineales bacterium]|nr:antibiotic biosynthesis monooxygenase [Anaerolineales bacterium]HLB49238.1 antibiotic biosynthesis monooxygenase [Anaerolineales bacterium]
MFITVTSSKVTPEQFKQVEAFLNGFLPRLKQQPGIVAIYHYARPEQGDEITTVVWKSQEAVKAYRESDLIKEAIVVETQLNLPATREGYPLVYGTSVES